MACDSLLHDDMSVTSCQQTCCKLIVKTCFHSLSASCFSKLYRAVARTLIGGGGGVYKIDFKRS